MRISRRHEVEELDGSVTAEGDLRLTGRLGPFPIVGTLPVELVVQPWEAVPEQTCAVPFRVIRPVQFDGRLSVAREEIHVDVDPSWGFLEPILKPVIRHFLKSKGWTVS